MSLRFIVFETTLFESGDARENAEKNLCWLLEALTQRNQIYLTEHPETPLLYKSGVVYARPAQMGECHEVEVLREALGGKVGKPEVAEVLDIIRRSLGGERFRDIGVILEAGAVDCFPLTQKIIVRSKSTGMYELVSLGELRFAYSAYEALSYNFETKQQEFKSIIGFVDKGVKPVSKARLSNGTDLVATDSHKFWTIDGQKQQRPYPDSFRLGERTMGEYVKTYLDAKSGKISKIQRTYKSRILQASSIPALNVVHPSTAETYLAGIYAAEGFKGDYSTSIAQHKSHVRERIESTLLELGMKYSYHAGRGKTPGSGAEYRLLGGNQNETIARLRELGVDSFDKRFPQSYLSGSVETVRQLLDAHADGDGWRPRSGVEYKHTGAKRMSVEYSTSSDALMEQIRLGLMILGKKTYTYHQKNHQGSGDSPIWRIDEHNENTPKLLVRQKLVEELGFPGLTYGTVRNAVPFGEAHVGCIEVEGNHNFFLADGTLVANCDNLACWRAAELRQKGIKAKPWLKGRQRDDGGWTYHVMVLWPDGSWEDPSLLLGMGGAEKAVDRAEEVRKNQERVDMALAAARKPQGEGLSDLMNWVERQNNANELDEFSLWGSP